jgi:phospholipase C
MFKPLAFVFAAVVAIATLVASATPQYDHFVVLMLENRAFDTQCGWLNRINPKIDGLKPSMFNEFQGQKYFVNDSCPYINPFDPDHSFAATTNEIFSTENPKIEPAPMNGFIKQAASSHYAPLENVMNAFNAETVPAISTLAQEFAIFDKYFVDFPGETVINRLFFHMGQSDRKVIASDKDVILGWKGQTIYDFFSQSDISWRAYFEDISDLWYTDSMRKLKDVFEKFRTYEHFAKDAAAGNLPKFTWISPRFYADFGKAARDQHPRHNVVDGEDIIAEVYAALRNSPKWNKTALLITYDEHGGFHDHVSPPFNAPPMPVSTDDQSAFNWTRLGLRVCTVLVSPWVEKGSVIGRPTGTSSSYTHTSIFNTLRNLWNFPNKPLSARQAWAAPYDWVLKQRQTPRTDCPTSIPTPKMSATERAREAQRQATQPPSDLHIEFYHVIEGMHGRDGSGVERFKTEGELGAHVRAEVEKFMQKKAPARLRNLKK